MTLLYAAQQFTLYAGFLLLIAGVIGNGMNILVFLKVRGYRTTPCTFYFLVASIINIFYILLNLSIRILSVGYNINTTGTLDVWCKIRQFFLVTLSIVSVSFSCLAAIDQFLLTSKSVNFRRFSNIQWAHRIALIVIIIWCFHGIPVLLYSAVSPNSNTCVIVNDGFSVYSTVYLLGIICAFPALIMIVFGWLTYRNIQQTIVLAERQADRQLVRMTSVQVVLVLISLVPYGIYIAYSVITTAVIKDYDRQVKEYFIYTVVSMGTYVFYVGSCYTFLMTSKRFRQHVKDRLFPWRERNRINP